MLPSPPLCYLLQAAFSCTKTLDCGHACCGIANEDKCLPCLQSECVEKRREVREKKRAQVLSGAATAPSPATPAPDAAVSAGQQAVHLVLTDGSKEV